MVIEDEFAGAAGIDKIVDAEALGADLKGLEAGLGSQRCGAGHRRPFESNSNGS